MKLTSLVVSLPLFLVAAPVMAASDPCPASITDALTKAFPDAKLAKCEADTGAGGKAYEAKLMRGKLEIEVDLSAKAELLHVEEDVLPASLPAAVTKALAARYPGAKPAKVEKTTIGTAVTYEIEVRVDGKKKEATFQQDGAFLKED